MAQIIALPYAQSERVIQTRIRGRLPRTITSLNTVRRDRRHAAYKADLLKTEIRELRGSLAIFESTTENTRYRIALMEQKLSRGQL